MSIQVYDGSGYLQIPGTPGPQSFAHVGPTAPEEPEVGQMWVDDSSHLIDQWDDEWQYPVLLNGWVDYSTGFGPARYRKTASGLVYVAGLVKNGPIGYNAPQAVFTLPVGYRVTQRHVIAGLAYNGTADCRINVDAQNHLSVAVGSASWSSICCYYYAEA